jgi:selenocysteine lyase/cysteine desulfurase
MLGIHALHASLELLLETGIGQIAAQVLDNTRFMLEFLAAHGDRYEIITPATPGRHAGIVTFRPLDATPESLFERLRQHNVACALRGGGIRFSPHFYTPRERLHAALRLLDAAPPPAG